MDFINSIHPAIVQALIVLVAVASIVGVVYAVRYFRTTSIYTRNAWLIDTVTDNMLAIAVKIGQSAFVTSEEYAEYQIEAEQLGWDIRKVMVVRETEQMARAYGFKVDALHIANMVEAILIKNPLFPNSLDKPITVNSQAVEPVRKTANKYN